MPDKYLNFEQLFMHEKEGIDYSILTIPRAARVLVMAPHGGLIEPGTSEIASKIAGDDYSQYHFKGIRNRPHSDLHITSHRYDEPQAVAIVSDRDIVVAIHGRSDRDDAETTWIGGLDADTGRNILRELETAGFRAKIETSEIGATHHRNICNRGRNSAGVQLEIPRSLRDQLLSEPKALELFAQAVRKAFDGI